MIYSISTFLTRLMFRLHFCIQKRIGCFPFSTRDDM